MRPPQSSADAPPGAEAGTGDAGTSEAYDFITQVTSIEMTAPSTSGAPPPPPAASASQDQDATTAGTPGHRSRRRRSRHHPHHHHHHHHRRYGGGAAMATSSSSFRREGPLLRRGWDALWSSLCFCFPSSIDELDESAAEAAARGGEGGGGGGGGRRRGGATSSSSAATTTSTAAASAGVTRSASSASSSAAASSCSSLGGASSGSGSDLLLYPPAPPQAPPFEGPPVIGPRSADDAASGKKTLVLDLDETLVHSSFRPVPNADFVIPVEIDGRCVDVYVLKRPHVDEFLAQVGPRFEVVVFTASLAKYADPLLDLLDARTNAFKWRLFREHCVAFEGNYVKDLQCLGRPLTDSIIVDNSPHSYVFQPDNAVPVSTFIDDPADVELLQILPLLLAVERVPDVRPHLAHHVARLAEAQASRGRGEGG